MSSGGRTEAASAPGKKLESEVQGNLDLSKLRYSMVWEDSTILSSGLNIVPSDIVISITSAGDNVLRLLLDGPKKIIAVDFSPMQNAALRLKIAAIKELTRDQALVVLGYRGTPEERCEIFSSLKTLPAADKAMLEGKIGEGLVMSGKLEKFFETLRSECFERFTGKESLKDFILKRTPKERLEIFESWPQNAMFDVLWEHCMAVISDGGRDSAQFKYVGMNPWQYGKTTASRITQYILREAQACEPNHYLSAFLLGTDFFGEEFETDDVDHHLPHFLWSYNFCQLAGLVDRIEIVTGSVEDLLSTPDFKFDKANLSDIFEYMSDEAAQELFQKLADCCSTGGRIGLWNLWLSRYPVHPSQRQTRGFEVLGGNSITLTLQDQIPLYQEFLVCECMD